MATSRAKLDSNARRLKEKLDQITIRPYKEDGRLIREAADRSGESLQAYILNAIRSRMESENR